MISNSSSEYDRKDLSASIKGPLPISIHHPHCSVSSSFHGVPLVVITGVPDANASATTIPKFSE